MNRDWLRRRTSLQHVQRNERVSFSETGEGETCTCSTYRTYSTVSTVNITDSAYSAVSVVSTISNLSTVSSGGTVSTGGTVFTAGTRGAQINELKKGAQIPILKSHLYFYIEKRADLLVCYR